MNILRLLLVILLTWLATWTLAFSDWAAATAIELFVEVASEHD